MFKITNVENLKLTFTIVENVMSEWGSPQREYQIWNPNWQPRWNEEQGWMPYLVLRAYSEAKICWLMLRMTNRQDLHIPNWILNIVEKTDLNICFKNQFPL